MKRAAALILALALMFSPTLPVMGADILIETVQEPQTGSIGGEWAVIAISRSGTDIPDGYYDTYLNSVEEKLVENDGILDSRKYTEYARVSLALAALGEDPRDFRGFDVLAPLKDVNMVRIQGNNGPIWALIAVDSYDYEGYAETKEELLDIILDSQNEDGGYGLISGDASDTDLTAMALTALAPHTGEGEVSETVEKGISWLSRKQKEGFESCEACAQSLLAWSSLDLEKEADECREALEQFAQEGGYRHELQEESPNGMSTEQALYSIAAYERMKNGDCRLFDMRDVFPTEK